MAFKPNGLAGVQRRYRAIFGGEKFIMCGTVGLAELWRDAAGSTPHDLQNFALP